MIQQLLVTVSNTPVGTPVFVDVAGNGKALLPVTGADNRDGKLIIACAGKASGETAKPSKAEGVAVGQVASLAKVLLSEFGGPKKDESACEMAVRVLREQAAQIEQLTAPAAKAGPAPGGETLSDEIELR